MRFSSRFDFVANPQVCDAALCPHFFADPVLRHSLEKWPSGERFRPGQPSNTLNLLCKLASSREESVAKLPALVA